MGAKLSPGTEELRSRSSDQGYVTDKGCSVSCNIIHKTVLDSGFHDVESRFQVLDQTWIPDTLSVELGLNPDSNR